MGAPASCSSLSRSGETVAGSLCPSNGIVFEPVTKWRNCRRLSLSKQRHRVRACHEVEKLSQALSVQATASCSSLSRSGETVAGSLCPSNGHNPSKKDVTAMEVESCCDLVRHDVLHDSPSCFMQVSTASISKNAHLPIKTGSKKCK